MLNSGKRHHKIKFRYDKAARRTVAVLDDYEVYTLACCLKCYNEVNGEHLHLLNCRLSIRREICEECGELKHVVISEHPIFY